MLIGRGSELARIGQLLAEARLGTSGVLVIAGEPGVGKTALLRHAVEEARGMTVLQDKGVESEAELPFAGLYALLRPAFDRLDALPPRQAAALKGALGLSPGVESDAPPLATAVGLSASDWSDGGGAVPGVTVNVADRAASKDAAPFFARSPGRGCARALQRQRLRLESPDCEPPDDPPD